MPNPKTAPSQAPPPAPQGGYVRKCDLDSHLNRFYPIPTQVVSNEEFIPIRQTAQQRAVERHLDRLAGDHGRKLGLDRRTFLHSACGLAASFVALNRVFGQVFRIDPAELSDPAAVQALKTDYFIFDVQTHHVKTGYENQGLLGFRLYARQWNPALNRREPRPEDLYLENFIKEVFLDSDTDMAVVSGIPAETDDTNILPPDQMPKTRDWVNRLTSSRRVISHGLMSPDLGTRNLESMQVQAEKLKMDSWKGYTGQGLAPNTRGWWLSDERIAYPALERSRKLGIRNICVHKGLAGGLFDEEYCHPRDVAKVSKDFPDFNFLIYHSALKSVEAALPAAQSDFRSTTYVPWVSDLCRARKENAHMTNVYMELGSTFGMMAVTHPKLCAHVLEMILDAFGDDRVLWGTDSIWWGSPQWQIEALRRLEMPEDLMTRFGWKPLTTDVKRKIFGMNAARVYKVDPGAVRKPVPGDYIEQLRRLRTERGAMRPSNTQYGWVLA